MVDPSGETAEKAGERGMKTAAAAIEFGTSKIVTLIAESGSFTRCDIIGSGTVPYAGFMNGEWNDKDRLTEAIQASIQAAQTEAKRTIQEVFVGVPGEYIHVSTAEGEVDVMSADGRVGEEDIAAVMDDAADKLNLAENGGNVLHRSPAWFQVDSARRTMSPLNTRGKVLRARISFIQADGAFIEDVRACLAELGLQVTAFLSPTLGTALWLMHYDERDKTPALIDIGYLNTEFSVIQGDAIIYHAVLPIGGGDMTADLAEALEISMDEAERIKRDHVFTPDEFDEQGDPSVTMQDGTNVRFPLEFVTQTIEGVTEELAEDLKAVMDDARDCLTDRSVLYLTGGALVNMRGAKEYMAEKLGRTVRVPVAKAARLNNPCYASALGLMDLVFDEIDGQQDGSSGSTGALSGIKNIFKRGEK